MFSSINMFPASILAPGIKQGRAHKYQKGSRHNSSKSERFRAWEACSSSSGKKTKSKVSGTCEEKNVDSIIELKRNLGYWIRMYPPPHMTCMYPPPQIKCVTTCYYLLMWLPVTSVTTRDSLQHNQAICALPRAQSSGICAPGSTLVQNLCSREHNPAIFVRPEAILSSICAPGSTAQHYLCSREHD